jgi:hypothetical protein
MQEALLRSIQDFVSAGSNIKSPGEMDEERAHQDSLTRRHTIDWDRRTFAGAAYRTDKGSRGQTRTSRTAVAHPWDPERRNPDGTATSPIMFSAAESATRSAEKEAYRRQEQIGKALRSLWRYGAAEQGGVDQYYSDQMRLKNRRCLTHDQPNKHDDRRCPRCYSPRHQFTSLCDVPDSDRPGTVKTGLDQLRSTDGTVLSEPGTPFCRLCLQWGHAPVDCVICSLCNRHGHLELNCGSMFLPPN